MWKIKKSMLWKQNRKDGNFLTIKVSCSVGKSVLSKHFPACYWFICTVFTGNGFLGMWNTMANPKMLSLPALLNKREVPAFSCLLLIDLCHFHILNFTTLFLIPKKPLPVKTPQIHVNYRQENAFISCLAIKEWSLLKCW